jgi:hypothetical protein
MISGSHAARVAATLPGNMPCFTRSRWSAGRTVVKAMALDISDILPSNTVAVLQLFDNVAYYAVTMEDTIIPCRKDQQGKYHMDRDLLLAPPQILAPYIKNCTGIFSELANVPRLVLSPLPRYLTLGCCSDMEFALSRVEPDFRNKIISSAERLQKAIQNQLLSNGVRNYKSPEPSLVDSRQQPALG